MIERRIVTPVKFANAYQCTKDGGCPQRNDEQGCPKWWECAGEEVEPGTLKKIPIIVAGCMDSQKLIGTYLEAAWNNSNADRSQAAEMREQILNRIGVVLANNLKNIPAEVVEAAMRISHERENSDDQVNGAEMSGAAITSGSV